jgi:hypothetical protein
VTPAGRTDTIEVGPALRESVSVALRHWPVVLLSLAAVAAWSLLVLFVIGRSMASPAGFSSDAGETLAPLSVWFGTRFVTWLILGAVVYRILTAEVGVRPDAQDGRDPRLRMFLACVLCFATTSLAALAGRLALALVLSGLGLPEIDYKVMPPSIPVLAEAVLINIALAYIAARFAWFTVFLLQRRDSGAFVASWAVASGVRLKLFLVLLVIDLSLFFLQVSVIAGMTNTIDLEPAVRWLSDFAHYPYQEALNRVLTLATYPLNVLTGALYAGVLVTIFRWLAGRDARAFD